MSDVELLTELAKRQYRATEATLHPLHQHAVDGRGVYRLEQRDGPAWLLRAFRQAGGEGETMAGLAACAATLLFLEQQEYPAPRVIRTVDGAIIGSDQNWITLVLTFIEGTEADSTLENLRSLGYMLGRLHTLEVAKAAATSPPVPASRWQPGRTIASLRRNCSALLRFVPSDRRPIRQAQGRPLTVDRGKA